MNLPTEYYKKYKHLKGKTGVYKIENIVNGKFYIGSTANKEGFLKRFCEHLRELINNLHSNRHLQFSFNSYGIDCFEFSIIEECEIEKCLERENFYLKELKPEYNLMFDAKLPGLGRRGKLNAHSKSVLCVNDGKIFESLGLAADFYNVLCTHISLVCNKKAWQTGGYCFCFIDDNDRKIELTEYLNSNKYMKNTNSLPIYCVNNNKIYANSTDVAKDLNLSSRNIRQCVEQSKQTHLGYCFCRPDDLERINFLKESLEKDPCFGKKSKSYPVERSDGKQYNSLVEAAKDMNCNPKSIGEVLNKRKKSIFGFSFKKLDILFIGYNNTIIQDDEVNV